MAQCRTCGNSVSEQSPYCSRCGTPDPAQAVGPPPPPAPAAPPAWLAGAGQPPAPGQPGSWGPGPAPGGPPPPTPVVKKRSPANKAVKIVAGIVGALLVVLIVIAATSSNGDDEPAAGDVVTDGTTRFPDDVFEEVIGACVTGVGSDSPGATPSQIRSFCECTWNEAQRSGIPFSRFTGQEKASASGTSTTRSPSAATPDDVQAVFDTCQEELAEA